MNKFENYLKENRDQLQREERGSDDLWNNIAYQVDQKRHRRVKLVYGLVASLAILLSVTTLIKISVMEHERDNNLPLYAFSQEYGDAEQELSFAVSYEERQVNNILASKRDKVEAASFLEGLEDLDNTYNIYKKIIEEEGCDKIMMELILENYRRRLYLLESLNKTLKTEHNEDKRESAKVAI